MKPKSSSCLNAYLAVGIGATATLPTFADAGIVYFDVDPDHSIGLDGTVNFGNIDLGTGSYLLNDTSGVTFGLTFPGESGGLFGDLNPIGNIEWGYTGGSVERLTTVDIISASSPWSWAAAPAAHLISGYVGGDGNWGFSAPGDSSTGFAPLRINAGGGNYQYGWAEITTVAGNIYSPPYLGTSSVTISGFAFNTNLNEQIEAGAIPEPSTVTCLLLGGSAFAFSRRRRMEAQRAES